eukprot:469065-Prorocentrum_minimum.AAC.1
MRFLLYRTYRCSPPPSPLKMLAIACERAGSTNLLGGQPCTPLPTSSALSACGALITRCAPPPYTPLLQ